MRAALVSLLLVVPVVFAQEADVTHEAYGLARKGKIADAERLLRGRLEAAPDDEAARELLAQLLEWDGRPDAAVELLDAPGASAHALALAADALRRQAQDGPRVTRRRGQVTYHPGDEAADAPWSHQRLERAAACLERALPQSPDDEELLVALAETRLDLEEPARAVELLEPRRAGGGGPLLLALGRALAAAQRPDDAIAALESGLSVAPRYDLEAFDALARLHEGQGSEGEADRARRRGRFYAWLPPFVDLRHDDAYDRFVRPPDDVVGAYADLESLADDPSVEGTALLTAMCFHHPHGAIEDRALGALALRADGPAALASLVERGDNACLRKHALKALAQSRSPDALAVMEGLLPGDVHPLWNLDVAGAMVALGDARAAPALARALDDTVNAESDDARLRLGARLARLRAAIALGHFDVPVAHEALRRGSDDPTIELACEAALLRLTGAPEVRAAVIHELARADGAVGVVVADLESLDDDELRGPIAAWRQRIEGSR